MKIFCIDCGVHFDNEFNQTLKCSFWKHRGLEKLAGKQKKKVWDWLFSFDFDKFGNETGYSLEVDWRGAEYKGNDFESKFDGYSKLDDNHRRKLQKNWFKFLSKLDPKTQQDLLFNFFLETYGYKKET